MVNLVLAQVETPAVVIDRSRLDRNLERMQERAERHGVALRPHIKTHKSIEIARRQLALGAKGITCAKSEEAAVFAEAGFDDIRLAYTVVAPAALDRLAQLSSRARISFCVDSLMGVEAAQQAFAASGHTAELLVEVDCGYGRSGVRPLDERALEVARSVVQTPALQLRGILTHAGQAYHSPRDGETAGCALERRMKHERDVMLDFRDRLLSSGLTLSPDFEVSVGSTPTASRFAQEDSGDRKVTELRPGNYVFTDLTQVDLGAVQLDDCALSVLATVVSTEHESDGVTRVILDAGKKVFTSDRRLGQEGYGLILEEARLDERPLRPWPGAEIHALSEEHGWCRFTERAPAVGDRVRVIPNHACVVVDTRAELVLAEDERVQAILPVDARGKSA